MKIVTSAGTLAKAAALASVAVSLKDIKRFTAFGAAQLRAGDQALLVLNTLDIMVSISFAADIAVPGTIAVDAEKLAQLAAALPKDAEIVIEARDDIRDGMVLGTASVKSGRRTFKLATVPANELPKDLELDVETGAVTLARTDAHALFARTHFATVGPKDARHYLNGVFLHSVDDELIAITTDGHKLAQYRVTSPSVLSDDRRLIVPAAAAEMAVRILADKSLDRVTLRRSRTLFAIEGANVQFTSRLLDADFPRYEAVLAAPAEGATVERVALRSALARARAVSGAREAQLTWTDDELHLTVTGASDDLVDAKVAASGAIMIDARKLSEIVEELDGPHVGLSAGAPGTPLRITTDDPGFLAILAPRINPSGDAP